MRNSSAARLSLENKVLMPSQSNSLVRPLEISAARCEELAAVALRLFAQRRFHPLSGENRLEIFPIDFSKPRRDRFRTFIRYEAKLFRIFLL